MILQLKITLRDSKPPIWRRIEIRDSMTFYELHQAIQIAFDWFDYHMHGFNVRRTNGFKINNSLSIKPAGNANYELIKTFDEDESLLKEIFKQEKDKVIYTYDYGDNWEHEIVLEKILPEQVGVFYPRCTKALRAAPEEDSRFEYLETGIVTENVDSKSLMEDINENFMSRFENEGAQSYNTDDLGEITQVGKEPGNWPRLLELTEELKQLQPWKWIDDDQIFAIQDPETKEYVYCSIMGAGGMEYGLSAFIGVEGIEYLRGLLTANIIDEKYYLKQRSLLISFSNRDELSKEDLQLLKEHGKSYRGKNQWPQFRSFRPGFYPWFLDEEEVRLLSLVIKQVMEVCRLAKKDPNLLAAEDLDWFFTREYDHKTRKWIDMRISVGTSLPMLEDVSLFVNELELQELKRTLKRSNIPLEFDCDYILTPTQDRPNERPYYPRLAFCVERKRGLIVYSDMVKTNNVGAVAQEALVGLIKQLNSIPREIWIKEEMFLYLKKIAKKLNIQLMVVQSLPFLEQARYEMEMMMR
ncbi:Plasmid pRiA4b ORF-3-like protein [Schinkia azotoformans MEV2011]|uniref:Plasmid pRiA4b ORF-3-like protein n=1 Tax=Schinkia azotoformans MEV2011 TaxID=1348973 RepID=A0A072NNI1_SCHAZ|nr:plasmid pRiA4b ORF-3 family protein [Schinkia azotoformans]KEF38478.1 Plasmid pRiA4b ORF-3-like protein [Schinkia azotoformans MEV2011]MEC1695665.1 plasmid pRiA4b ORF-3 family protein [Schinkia azotoformans]MEC1717663.1 plasmid pRiA4b ORF-3 family protein [Schinkia azotoformans]MEC1727676.1 plasmid pRiA4b ORF-3 family protein [Schinkia azotoformans]MEC1742399.1 plasmid pRiA4b ORF-3 family protein [Schinkia azotoformans]